MKFETPMNEAGPRPERNETGAETVSSEELQKRLELSGKIALNTNKIEYYLEHGIEPVVAHEGKPLNKGSRMGNWFRAALAAGMLMSGAGAKAETSESAASPEKGVPVPVLVSNAAEKETVSSPEALRQEFIKKTGFDMMSIAEKAGFKARLDVDNGEGSYIVHLGQEHLQGAAFEAMTEAERAAAYRNIISTQKNLEQIVLALSMNGSGSQTNVFSEGILETATIQTVYAENRERLSKITLGKGCFLEVLGSYRRMTVGRDDTDAPRIALTYLHRQKLKELQEYFLSRGDEYNPAKKDSGSPQESAKSPQKELTPYEKFEMEKEWMSRMDARNFEARRQMDEIVAERLKGIPEHPAFDTLKQEFDFVQKAMTNHYDTFGRDAIYLAGAVDKLAVEGKIAIVGTEEAAANIVASEALKKMVEAKKKYIGLLENPAGQKALSDAEKLKIIEELKLLSANWERTAMRDREDAALRLIGRKNSDQKHKIYITVYGRAHAFSEATKWSNTNNPGEPLGLVTFVPKEPASREK
ncbi:MAG TPA: hypothetical protein VK675_02065 [Candidatus Paceibacterota bacterium]|nr:hypothetical protein [Candidatus Paceibacterota bacterium]